MERWDSPSTGQLHVLLLCLERSRFPVPCFSGRPVDVWSGVEVGQSEQLSFAADSRSNPPILPSSRSPVTVTLNQRKLTTIVKRILLCVAFLAPAFLGKNRQIFSYLRPVCRNDNAGVFVMGVQNVLHRGVVALFLLIRRRKPRCTSFLLLPDPYPL